MTIKLYSKDPAREVGTNIQAYGGSRGTNHENISYSSASNDLKYYAYASHSDIDRTDYLHNGYTLSRDYKNAHALMTLNYKKLKLEAEYIDHKMDPFLSLSMFATPKSGDINYKLKRMGATTTFLNDDSLKLSFSFIRIDENLNLNMVRTRWTTNPLGLLLPQDSLVSESTDDVYNVKLEKKLTYNANHFVIGSEYVKKSMHDTKVYNNGILDTTQTFVDNSILSFYLQDDYTLSTNQIVTASIKHNDYHNKSERL